MLRFDFNISVFEIFFIIPLSGQKKIDELSFKNPLKEDSNNILYKSIIRRNGSLTLQECSRQVVCLRP